jgi:phosphoribosyl-dephospho-CoA transferase
VSRRKTQKAAPGKCLCCQVDAHKCGKPARGKSGKVQPLTLTKGVRGGLFLKGS